MQRLANFCPSVVSISTSAQRLGASCGRAWSNCNDILPQHSVDIRPRAAVISEMVDADISVHQRACQGVLDTELSFEPRSRVWSVSHRQWRHDSQSDLRYLLWRCNIGSHLKSGVGGPMRRELSRKQLDRISPSCLEQTDRAHRNPVSSDRRSDLRDRLGRTREGAQSHRGRR